MCRRINRLIIYIVAVIIITACGVLVFAATQIEQADAYIEAPHAGAVASKSITVPNGANYSASVINWTKGDEPRNNNLSDEEVFVGGQKYTVELNYKSLFSSYYFDQYTRFHLNEDGTSGISYSTTDGYYRYYTFTATEHSFIKHDAVNANDGNEGNIEYWECSECHKYFYDEKGLYELEENGWVVPEGAIASGKCGNQLKWVLDDQGTLTIEGKGSMFSFANKNEVPWNGYKDYIKHVDFDSRITTIGNYAFSGCTKLQGELVLPASVKEIGYQAFYSCSNLVGDILLPDTITTIGRSAFGNCSSLNGTLKLPSKLKRIEASTFYNCSSLAHKVFIPNTVEYIGDNAFSYTNIPYFYFKGSAPAVGENALSTTAHAVIYYDDKKTGWSSPLWNGYSAFPNDKNDGLSVFEIGDGSEDNPYVISNKEQLAAIKYDLTASYILGNDIVFDDSDFDIGGKYYNDGRLWIPIGDYQIAHTVNNKSEFNDLINKYHKVYIKKSYDYYEYVNMYDDSYDTYYHLEIFSGEFNGNGYSINNLRINCTNDSQKYYSGLFAYVKGAKIYDVGLVDCNYNIEVHGCYCGGIAGQIEGTILRNCYTSGVISCPSGRSKVSRCTRIGGIIGFGSVEKCYSGTSIVNNAWESDIIAGGIIGTGSAENCFNYGYLAGSRAGGIVGSGTAKCCYNVGSTPYSIQGYNLVTDRVSKNTYSITSTRDDDNKRNNTQYCSGDEMKLQETFGGFDFDSVWQIGNNDNYPYPELKGMTNTVVSIDKCNISLTKDVVQYGDYTPTVDVSYKGEKLKCYEDYILRTKIGDETPVVGRTIADSLGTGTVEIIGMGHYAGMITDTFAVEPFDISGAKMVVDVTYKDYVIEKMYFDGKPKKIGWFRLRNTTGLLLESDYEISYENNIFPGTATMVIKGKNNCTGEKRVDYIIEKSNCIFVEYKTAGCETDGVIEHWEYAGKCYNKEFSEEVKPDSLVIKSVGHSFVSVSTVNGCSYQQCSKCGRQKDFTAPSYVKGFKVSKGKGKFTAKWKKQNKKTQKLFSGYQVRWSTDPGMSGAGYRNVGRGKASVKIKGAKKTRYYVQVRTYTGGYYSSWSATKSVVTK